MSTRKIIQPRSQIAKKRGNSNKDKGGKEAATASTATEDTCREFHRRYPETSGMSVHDFTGLLTQIGMIIEHETGVEFAEADLDAFVVARPMYQAELTTRRPAAMPSYVEWFLNFHQSGALPVETTQPSILTQATLQQISIDTTYLSDHTIHQVSNWRIAKISTEHSVAARIAAFKGSLQTPRKTSSDNSPKDESPEVDGRSRSASEIQSENLDRPGGLDAPESY